MSQWPENLKVKYIYYVKTGPVPKRLRVKINDKAVWCGKSIINTYFHLCYIDTDSIKVRCDITGSIYKLDNLKKKVR